MLRFRGDTGAGRLYRHVTIHKGETMTVPDNDPIYGTTLKHLVCCGTCKKPIHECDCVFTAVEDAPLTDEEAFAILRERAKGDSEAEAAVEAFIDELKSIEGGAKANIVAQIQPLLDEDRNPHNEYDPIPKGALDGVNRLWPRSVECELPAEEPDIERVEVVGHIEVNENLCPGCGYHKAECVCGLPSFRAFDPEQDGSFSDFSTKREAFFDSLYRRPQ